MGYGRDDSRGDSQRDWREPRSRYDEQGRGPSSHGGDSDRGFFERAGDEIASWFGDENAEQRRERDDRSQGGSQRRSGGRFSGGQSDSYGRGADRDYGATRRSAGESGGFGRQPLMSDDDERHDRGARYRDEGYRRPYTGRSMGREDMGSGSSVGDNSGYRPMTGDYGRAQERDRAQGRPMGAMGSTAPHDRHYSEWRQRQVDELDRDYDDYRREHQSKFESDFSNWRGTRQTKRQMLGQVKEHMDVVGSDEQHVGTVDKVRGDHIVLTKSDSPDGQHHMIGCSSIDRIDGDKVILSSKADEAKAMMTSENRNRALFERDEDREPGAHMLNRSFSGTY